MMNNAYRREFDVVLFWSLDRFCCDSVLKTLQYLILLSSYGGAFKSFTEQYLDGTGIFKDAIIGILPVLAHQGRVRLSGRVTAALERASKEGRTGGRPRKQYERDNDAQKIRRCVRTARASETLPTN